VSSLAWPTSAALEKPRKEVTVRSRSSDRPSFRPRVNRWPLSARRFITRR
jgi:hypothetical protein